MSTALWMLGGLVLSLSVVAIVACTRAPAAVAHIAGFIALCVYILNIPMP